MKLQNDQNTLEITKYTKKSLKITKIPLPQNLKSDQNTPET